MSNPTDTPLLPVLGAKPTVTEPPVKTAPKVDIELLTSVDLNALEDSYVYVHCYFDNPERDMLIRIWKTTYLVDRTSGSRSKLLHTENISLAPLWTLVPDQTTYTFLLIFSALPKSCKTFDLLEDISQPGGFHVQNIHRNNNDVYHIDIR